MEGTGGFAQKGVGADETFCFGWNGHCADGEMMFFESKSLLSVCGIIIG